MWRLLMACALLTAACTSTSHRDGDCELPSPTSSPLAKEQSTRVVINLSGRHSQQWVDVNGQIYNFVDRPKADGLSGAGAPSGRHVFTLTRKGNRLFAEDETGRYELHGVGCA
jgi:hypothetical protein